MSAAFGTPPPSLAHSLLSRSLPSCRPSARPPAACACCLLPLSLALPAFAAHAGSYVTDNRRDFGEDAHKLCAAALRFGSGHSYFPAHLRSTGEIKGSAAKGGLVRSEAQRDSGITCFSVIPALAFSEGTFGAATASSGDPTDDAVAPQ